MTQQRRTPPLRRRGAAYVLVLSTGVLLSVVGLGLLTISRGTTRTAATNADLSEAAMLAESGVHWGISALKSNSNWRTTYTNNVETSPVTYGRGTMAFKLVDEVDGNLSNNSSDAVRLYGVGRCGSAVRLYSVELTGSGPVLDSLRNAVQAGENLIVGSSTVVAGGPLSANETLTVTSGVTVTGDVEAKTLSISGSVTGNKSTLGTSRSLPQPSVFDTYKAQATTIPFTSITGGTISNKVLSSASNPWGMPNPSGIYYIKVPSTGTLLVKTSRLVATLIVEVESGGVFGTSGAFAWDPPRSDYPALIVKGTSGGSMTLAGSTSSLSELMTLINFNPPGTPNSSGVADTDKSDSYPSEFHGLMHVIGAGYTTTLTSNFVLKGALIAEGKVTVGSGVKLTADPALATSPPLGYTSASEMLLSAASWRWNEKQ